MHRKEGNANRMMQEKCSIVCLELEIDVDSYKLVVIKDFSL